MTVISKHLEAILPKIIEIRQKLHEIPELKFEEFKTAKLISETLKSFGYNVENGIAKTGLTAILDTGKPGKTIGLRADMDALPIEEPNNNQHRSRHPGKMHACGHDGHCATLLAVAYALNQIKNELSGKVKFIFQPAEEGGKGSTAMIEAGVLKNPPLDEIYAFHNWPGLPEGIIGVKDGTILLGNGRIEISIKGKPAHTAQPENAVNPVTIGAELITKLEIERLSWSVNSTVLNILSFNSGKLRGMAEKSEIIAVYYIDTEDNLIELKSFINKYCDQVKDKYKAEIALSFKPFHSPTINTANETDKISNAARMVCGDKKIIKLEKSMIASEDFSEYLKHIPGCFFLVGAGESANPVHTDKFQFNDNVISTAANIICQMVINSNVKDGISAK